MMTDTTDNIETTDEQIDPVEAEETTDTDEPETFPASVVKDLRKENARYRERAKAADDLRAALWTARVAATGRLADPSDLALPEDADPLDEQAVAAAVDELLAVKPHLAARKVAGTVGQGHGGPTTGVDLASILRARS